MVLLVNKLKLGQLLKIPIRYKHPDHHWSVLRKKKTCKDKALEHFNEFYGTVYGQEWNNIRDALLMESSKYMAILNNFSDINKARSDIQELGAVNVKDIYDSHRDYMLSETKDKPLRLPQNTGDSLASLVSKAHLTKLETIYPNHENLSALTVPTEDQESEEQDRTKTQPVQMHSIEEELNTVDIDKSRIIDSKVNVSLLHEYVPATKLKGMDDWVLESDQYKLYAQVKDFKIDVVAESELPFPEHINAYVFIEESKLRFPNPKMGPTGVLDYYLFDGGSLLPVLALDIQPGDIVLDMCAAPGGKALTILQTLVPGVLVANDITKSRIKRLQNVFNQYVSTMCDNLGMLRVTEMDARAIDEKNIYNKILVDVPCTSDRHSLHSDDNNIFKPSRIKERLQIPQIQSQILTNALNLVTVGGTVVYATCSLSPIQNEGVVQASIKKAWENTGSILIVKDMTEALSPLMCIYQFSNIDLRYGHIVIPDPLSNFGPMYFCKIVKVQ